MATQSVHANFRKNSLLGTQKSAGGIQAVGELNSPFTAPFYFTACGCDTQGTVDNNDTCDENGICTCQNGNIEGDKCDTCIAGYSNFPTCSIDCKWGEWSNCSTSCGLGSQKRVPGTNFDGMNCTGESTRECNLGLCQHDCEEITTCNLCIWSKCEWCTKISDDQGKVVVITNKHINQLKFYQDFYNLYFILIF